MILPHDIFSACRAHDPEIGRSNRPPATTLLLSVIRCISVILTRWVGLTYLLARSPRIHSCRIDIQPTSIVCATLVLLSHRPISLDLASYQTRISGMSLTTTDLLGLFGICSGQRVNTCFCNVLSVSTDTDSLAQNYSNCSFSQVQFLSAF